METHVAIGHGLRVEALRHIGHCDESVKGSVRCVPLLRQLCSCLRVTSESPKADCPLLLNGGGDLDQSLAALHEVAGVIACRKAFRDQVAGDRSASDEQGRARDQHDREHPGPNARRPTPAPRLSSPPWVRTGNASHERTLSHWGSSDWAVPELW